MLFRFFSSHLICLSLILSVLTANAQNKGNSTSASASSVNTVPKLPYKERGSREAVIEADIADLEAHLLKQPDDAIALNNLATIYVRIGRLDAALNSMERSLALDDKLAKTHLNLGNLYDRLGRHVDALNAVSRSVQLEPNDPWSRSYLCELEMLTERNLEAVKCYRAYFNQFAATPRFRSNFGVALMRVGELKESVAVLKKEATERPLESAVQNTFAIALYRTKDYGSAVKVLEAAVKNHPDLAELRLNLGLSYLAANNRTGALGQYRQLSVSSAEHARLLYGHLFGKYILEVGKQKEGAK